MAISTVDLVPPGTIENSPPIYRWDNELPSTLSVAKAVQWIKGNSSKWIHETFLELRDFGWQEGYGAFSVGMSGQGATIAYIENQDEHHRRKTFDEELKAILEKHAIEYEDWMLE